MVWKFIAGILLIGMFLGLRQLVSTPKNPAMSLIPLHLRKPFPIDFSLPDLQGKSIRLTSLHGKVILLNFWATWCYPCRTELPSMNAVFKHYQSESFLVLAVASDSQGKEIVSPFVNLFGLTFPILLDPQDIVGRRLQIPGIPTSYVLDKQGRTAGTEVGARNWNSPLMHRLIDRLLAENNPDAS
jgi:thiol-disulfide isomerase/thioredoxin